MAHAGSRRRDAAGLLSDGPRKPIAVHSMNVSRPSSKRNGSRCRDEASEPRAPISSVGSALDVPSDPVVDLWRRGPPPLRRVPGARVEQPWLSVGGDRRPAADDRPFASCGGGLMAIAAPNSRRPIPVMATLVWADRRQHNNTGIPKSVITEWTISDWLFLLDVKIRVGCIFRSAAWSHLCAVVVCPIEG
jgi:hypothetical protein